MITQDVFTQGQSLITNVLEKIGNVGFRKRSALIEILLLFLSCRGRVNFSQLGRQGGRYEKTYRYHFARSMDWADFNRVQIEDATSDERIIGFDPSYISKSGKHTPGLGYFYSGVASRYKRGIEIGGIGIIDVKQNTAYHYEAVMSPSARKEKIEDGKTLVDHYADLIVNRSEKLKKLSTILVVDGYFAKRKFIDRIANDTNMEVICRLRDDANLKYLAPSVRKKGRGRPRLYTGKVNVNKIDKRKFKSIYEDSEKRVYQLVVYSVGLKRKVSICYVEFLEANGKVRTKKIFFSTKLDRDANTILKYYKSRFQMEFIFRDAKQYTGLEHCQARCENKLHFHFNASLTAVNIAKVILRQGTAKNVSIPLSVGNLQMKLQNRNMLKRIFSIYRLSPELLKNNVLLDKVITFGSKAA